MFINATTQPGYEQVGLPLIELNGANAGAGANGLTIKATGSTVKGLVINNFDNYGILIDGHNLNGLGGNTIADNFIGTATSGAERKPNGMSGVRINDSADNRITGNLISGNEEHGIEIQGLESKRNQILGNYIGTDKFGTQSLHNALHGVWIGADANQNYIGGVESGQRNIISGNKGDGVVIIGATSNANIVQSNYIGTKVNGIEPLANDGNGVTIVNASNNAIGVIGVAASANVISGNGKWGVEIRGTANKNSVSKALIGKDKDGKDRPGLGNGSGNINDKGKNSNIASNTTGGSSGPGVVLEGSDAVILSNEISSNAGAGILVLSGTGNQISQNSIHHNTGLGIDLGGDGVTANDPGDADTGPNNLQNFPVLTSGLRKGDGTTHVEGTIDSLAAYSAYPLTIEFFGNSTSAPYGQGETYLGSIVVQQPGPFATDLPFASFVSATATDANGNTSEFSATVAVSGGWITYGEASVSETENSTTITLGVAGRDEEDTQAQAYHGASLLLAPAAEYVITFSFDLATWDSYDEWAGFWDSFSVSITDEPYPDLNLSDPLSYPFVWGGTDWMDGILETTTGTLTLTIAGNLNGDNYLNFVLDTATEPTMDEYFPSWGTFTISW